MKVSPLRQEVQTGLEPATGREKLAAMIEIDRVSQLFQTSGRQSHLALSEISLAIEDGAFVSILGPSGCGKSTLLYIVGGFVSLEGRARQCDVRLASARRQTRGS
jgi:NitT/TauT family transport system ATP-binding protein